MAKLKNKKGVVKRFKLTKKGKIKYHPSGKSHLESNKKTKRIRRLRKGVILKGRREIKFLKKMLPYA